MAELIVTAPLPLPELVMFPVLLTPPVESVIVWVPAALSVRSPDPPTPPVRVSELPVPELPIVLALPRVTAPA